MVMSFVAESPAARQHHSASPADAHEYGQAFGATSNDGL
jgi:hypothetical protein